MQLEIRQKLEKFLNDKRKDIGSTIFRYKNQTDFIRTSFIYNEYDDSVDRAHIKLTHDLISYIENCRNFIQNASIISSRPKVLKQGYIKCRKFFLIPNMSLISGDTKIKITDVRSYENDYASMVNTRRFRYVFHYRNDGTSFHAKVKCIPEIFNSILYPVNNYQNPINQWDVESGWIIYESIFNGLEEKYQALEDEIVNKLKEQISIADSFLQKESENPKSKTRRSFREKLIQFLTGPGQGFDVSQETIAKLLELDPEKLILFAKWMRRNNQDLELIHDEDIQTAIDMSNVKLILKS